MSPHQTNVNNSEENGTCPRVSAGDDGERSFSLFKISRNFACQSSGDVLERCLLLPFFDLSPSPFEISLNWSACDSALGCSKTWTGDGSPDCVARSELTLDAAATYSKPPRSSSLIAVVDIAVDFAFGSVAELFLPSDLLSCR
jgi:hypothetical protein